MTLDELKAVLDQHVKWVRGEAGGQRANLRDADLGGANLRDADLRGAYLGGAYLGGANLGGANLRDANLRDAYLRGANLRDANLRDADLRGANLRAADLRGADLGDADLRGAYLGGAKLRDADLRGAYLGDADLGGAYLGGADLRGADLRGAYLGEDFTLDGFIRDVVPALVVAGGKTAVEVVTPKTWNCHTWGAPGQLSCPMAVAFGVHAVTDIPVLYRATARLFIALFDVHAIPLRAVEEACGLPVTESAA